jgi:hypothetical protein
MKIEENRGKRDGKKKQKRAGNQGFALNLVYGRKWAVLEKPCIKS